jgi:5-methylcytosine-specific restriction endonuclease McrA
VLWAREIEHHGLIITKKLISRSIVRKDRRRRNCRYRQRRYKNRARTLGWLHPSATSRLSNVTHWIAKIFNLINATSFSIEKVKFDRHLVVGKNFLSLEYQHDSLLGYEIKEYLLEKWNYKCAYCGVNAKKLEIEHVVPRSRGGSDSIGNLVLACHKCNQNKGNKTAKEFGYPDIQLKAKRSMRSTTATEILCKRLHNKLLEYGVDVEVGTGAKTYFNRNSQRLKKEHWIDSACVGDSGSNIFIPKNLSAIYIKSIGHGNRQKCRTDKYGFPCVKAKQSKEVNGFKTGDYVIAKTKKACYVGRITVRKRGDFDIYTSSGFVNGISWKYCKTIYKNDGYLYSFNKS